MPADHLLTLDDRGFLHCQITLQQYLPGLDPGLTALGAKEALIAEPTLVALQEAYGKAGRSAILRQAGVLASKTLGQAEALDRLAHRDLASLPARASSPADRGWHLDEVNVRAAWTQHWGGPDAIDWGSVKVGQIDTGYTPHPVLGFPGPPWLDVAAGRTIFAAGEDGGDPGPGQGVDPLAGQMDGHGTRVASVICGHDASAPLGTYLGIAPKVPLVPVRIANIVLISHAQRELAQALRYLVNDAKVSVINLSMGFLPRTQMKVLDKAIDEAYEAGVIFVCAAGQPLRYVVSPAHGRRTIAAAGSTLGSVPWGKSAYGGAVDWAAPADHIHRAEMRRPATPGYAGAGDGTSYAAAITTGAAALWLARHAASLPAAYPAPWQRVEAFKAAAKATARRMPHQQPGSFGAGVLDVAALLNAALPPAGSLLQEEPA
jgi:subtilisin family serine protease